MYTHLGAGPLARDVAGYPGANRQKRIPCHYQCFQGQGTPYRLFSGGPSPNHASFVFGGSGLAIDAGLNRYQLLV